MAGALALGLYAPLLAAALVAVWRRPVLALYAFLVGLALHNVVMALLYGAGVRGVPLTAIQAWKEALLAAALASVAVRAARGRRLPFRPGAVDALAAAFAAVVLVYALIPQRLLGGEADAHAVSLGLRHALLPVAAFLLGRSLQLRAAELRRLAWTVIGVAAAVAVYGLVDVYAVSLDWWRRSGAPGWFREQLDLEYRGLSGLPENFVYNPGDERPLRRLVSTFLSPLATAYLLAAALLVLAAARRFSWRVAAPAALLFSALLFTHSRSAWLALAVGLAVLALARRAWWPLAAAAAVLLVGAGFVRIYDDIGPRTSFTAAELRIQRADAARNPGVSHDPLDPDESSIASHWRNLRDGLETVALHPQGYGLGNAGATAKRADVPLKAGESNYAELGVEVGLIGLLLFVAWSLALLVALVRSGRAAIAGVLALVLALAVQTDAIGVPWLAYGLWSVAGALLTLERATVDTRTTARRPVRSELLVPPSGVSSGRSRTPSQKE